MNIKDYIKEVKDIESEIIYEYDKHISGFKEQEKYVAALLLNDTIDLIEDMTRDRYMFDVSLENYNNGISFMPQYYFENSVIRDDMIWERICIIIAIAYEIDFKVIFDKKSIYPLYDIIKKDSNINKSIKLLLQKINGDCKLRELKFIRNDGEHFISRHLTEIDDKEFYSDSAENVYSIDDGILHADRDQINKVTNAINYDTMIVLKSRYKDIQRKQYDYKEIIKLCIYELGKAFRKSSFVFNQYKYFIPHGKWYKVEKDILEKCAKLEEQYEILRDDFRNVIDKKNETVFTLLEEGEKVRDTLLIDSIFRAKEMIRSINMFFLCTAYSIDGKIAAPFSEELFNRYCYNDLINVYYYYDHVILKLYSVYEKVAKFLICKYDFDKEYLDESKFKNMYLEKVLEVFEKRTYSSKILDQFKKCVTCKAFQDYEIARNREYHRIRSRYFNQDLSLEIANTKIMKDAMESLLELFILITNEENEILECMIKNHKQNAEP